MVVNAVNYFYHLIMGRLLGPVDYGILASLYSVLYLISIVPSSTSVSIVKFVSSAKDKNEVKYIYQSIRKSIFNIAIILSITFLIFSPFIISFLNLQESLSVVLISPILFFVLISLVNQATSQGLLNFFGLVTPNLVSALVKLGVGVGLVLMGFRVNGAIFGVVLASLFAYLSSTFFVKKINDFKSIRSNFKIKSFFRFALPVLVQALAFTSIFSTDVILVKHFLPAFEAGLYASLSTLGKIIYFAVSPVTATMFPIVSRKKAKGENYMKVFVTSLFIILGIATIIVLGYYLFPNLAIGILYGKQYLIAAPQLIWMSLFFLVYSLLYFLVNFMLSLGRVKVVVVPFLAAIFQIILISHWHKDILQVIQASLLTTSVALLIIIYSIVYNQYIKNGEN